MSNQADQVATMLGDATLAELSADLRGEAIVPGDAEYEARRAIWNTCCTRFPPWRICAKN